MTGEIENLILEHLRAIRGDIAKLHTEVRELKDRVTRVELGLASLKREVAVQGETLAHIQIYMDRSDEKFDRIERRLDLGDTLPPLV